MLNELYRFDVTLADVGEPEQVECPSCVGMGVIDIGDDEDGVWAECPRCLGTGKEEAEYDDFEPKRDAWQVSE